MDDSTKNDKITEKDFSDILAELSNSEVLNEIDDNETSEIDEFETVTDDNVNDFILKYGSMLVKDGIDAVNKVKPKITTAQDADEIKALSDMMRAINSTLDTLTKISLQNKKTNLTTEVKQLECTTKKELSEQPNTQILVSTREDIFKELLQEEKKAIDIIEEEED
jgi:hypothetical protein